MRLPVAWLKTYVPKLPATSKLVEGLMMHGLDVENVLENDSQYANVVVGEIVGIKPHPNADKLRLADVITRPDGEPQEIVCGAPNIEVGQKVPVALLGAKLPNGLTIAKRAIRGVESHGMLCAADELGLGTDHSGIMVLDSGLEVGTAFVQAIGADDQVIDLAVPANRADLMAVRGLAWEIGAMLGQTAKLPAVKLTESKVAAKTSVTLQIVDSKLCSRLTARVIRGVTMKPTPAWMVNRLRAAGMRSVNIMADITNYVMLDYGQPLHAYDADKVRGQALIARRATAGEQLETLDGKTRALTPETLVIADAERAIGVAGVMGGQDTEVTAATTDIILEAAIFDPVSIRKTSRNLGLISEASKRFEKGLWPSLPARASAAAAALMVELCGGTVEQGSVSVGTAKIKSRTITMDPAYISQRLGVKVPAAKCKTVLTKLGFMIKGTATSWKIGVPEWRPDATLPEDIVDEVGRMVGYEKLPKKMPTGGTEKKDLPRMIRFIEEVRNILVDMGFTEVISHAFYGEDNARIVRGRHFEVANPLDATQHKLRKSLLPQVFEVLKRQAEAGQDAAVFEIGRIFNPEQKGDIVQQQPWKLAIGFAQKPDGSNPLIFTETTQQLFEQLGADFDTKDLSKPEDVFRARRLKYCEIDLLELMAKKRIAFGPWDPTRHVKLNVKYQEQSKYPVIKRDISFFTPDGFDAHQILQLIVASLGDEQELFDKGDFKTDSFTKDGRISMFIHLVFRSLDRTLTKAEVDKLEQKIKDALVNLGATIR